MLSMMMTMPAMFDSTALCRRARASEDHISYQYRLSQHYTNEQVSNHHHTSAEMYLNVAGINSRIEINTMIPATSCSHIRVSCTPTLRKSYC